MHYFGLPKTRQGFLTKCIHSTTLHRTDVWECFGAFQKCLVPKKMQNLGFGLNTLIRGREVAKMVSPQMHPFYSIVLKVMFGSGLEHLQTFSI
jgi:hypothetical protein